MGLCDCGCDGDDNDYEDDYGRDNMMTNITAMVAQDDDDDDGGARRRCGGGDGCSLYAPLIRGRWAPLIWHAAQTKTHDYGKEAQ